MTSLVTSFLILISLIYFLKSTECMSFTFLKKVKEQIMRYAHERTKIQKHNSIEAVEPVSINFFFYLQVNSMRFQPICLLRYQKCSLRQ